MIKKSICSLVLVCFFLSSCVTVPMGGTSNADLRVGPKSSGTFFDQPDSNEETAPVRLNVAIPVFDPGLPEDEDQELEEGVWPELRRAEANRFALQLKRALEQTQAFGAVRVTPDAEASADLYVLGRIEESTGEEIDIDLKVIDSAGRLWMDESFDHEVSENFFSNLRNQGKDPYEPVFEEAAVEIADLLTGRTSNDLEDLQSITFLRFGQSFSEESFASYLSEQNGQFRLTALPSDADPMVRRIEAIQVRDQYFIDGMQENYETFSANMETSYRLWQEQSLIELKAAREARNAAIAEAAGGVLLIGLSVLAVIAGANSDNIGTQTAATTGAVVGGIAGASMIGKSFKTSEEAKFHREALNELGQSVDMDLAPQVIELEKQSVELTGDAREQFHQWREFLQKIYQQEATPDVQL